MLSSSSKQADVEGSEIYPCIKVYDHPLSWFLVLFTSPNTGTVVDPGTSPRTLGYHSFEWSEKASFLPFKGVVTIKSE